MKNKKLEWWRKWIRYYLRPCKNTKEREERTLRFKLFLPKLAHRVTGKCHAKTKNKQILVRLEPLEIERIMEVFGYKREDD